VLLNDVGRHLASGCHLDAVRSSPRPDLGATGPLTAYAVAAVAVAAGLLARLEDLKAA
jgi:hypothetical protein